ncbi:MAG: hypothetical protein GF330_12245, partial [Candidatus Eisenbacteria bacterium]|nr:hypothetical protein [Candidatus Eisenbacteria bacterium]
TTDFEDGHIPGAHMVSLANVVDYEADNNTENLPVVCVCYTGHSAGHAVMALRLQGIEAQSLAWGMSAWHSDFDMWSTKVGDIAYDYVGTCWEEPETTPPALESFTNMPQIDSGESNGAAILEYQLDTAVLDGLNGVANTVVLQDCDDYQVYCYWTIDDWNLYGNIAGSFQVTPGDLTLESLDMLDPDETQVFYCWSGQTASMIAAWLNVLGYDAHTLIFSANGIIHADLLEKKWGEGSLVPLDFDYDTGP